MANRRFIAIHEFLYLIANCENRVQFINKLPKTKYSTTKRGENDHYDIDFDIKKSRLIQDRCNAIMDQKTNYGNITYYKKEEADTKKLSKSKSESRTATLKKKLDA